MSWATRHHIPKGASHPILGGKDIPALACNGRLDLVRVIGPFRYRMDKPSGDFPMGLPIMMR